MVDMTPASMYLMNNASGTSVNPASWPMPMIMTHFGSWNRMLMGLGFILDTQQSGPRGGDKLYSPNWFMASAEHRLGNAGAFQFDLMLSLDPATIMGERYPLLFQTGETAYGKPLVDAQHPHNFIMGLGLHYARELAEDTTLELYSAPVGDPALGPTAYPHRASAMELPEATISHHWQDSTHISFDVVTVGLQYQKFKLEASGFHGAEPGENRWIIQQGPIDSWSGRLWFFPTKYWAAQVSFGRLWTTCSLTTLLYSSISTCCTAARSGSARIRGAIRVTLICSGMSRPESARISPLTRYRMRSSPITATIPSAPISLSASGFAGPILEKREPK